MIDPARLAAFAALTALTSVVPGPNMLFLAAQAAWRGGRGGALALGGLQIGNALWFVLAGLGLGTLLAAWPRAFVALTVAGALYLAWLGIAALRHAGADESPTTPARASPRPLRDGIVVALSNPKSLVYVAALLPPFVDPRQPVAAQLGLLALVAIALDVVVGALYIGAGSRLAAAVARPRLRRALERAIGAIFLAIAAAVIVGVLR